MKKILITYVSYGSGHKTIAQYIANHLQNKDYEIKLVDLVDYMGNFTLKTVDIFDYIYNHRLEKVFSFLYRISDNGFVNQNYKIYTKKCLYNNMTKKLFSDFNPDIVLSTHWYGSNIAAYMKKKKMINPKIVTVVTDYKVHKMWMTSYDKEEHFVVANNIVKDAMQKRGCYSCNIYAYGLPVDFKKVAEVMPKSEIYKKYGLTSHNPKILFFGGGSNGSMSYLKYLKKLLILNKNYEVLFVCGNNKELYDCTKKLEKTYPHLKTFGFITNVYELMDISEIVISKSGGATVTECLEMQKYMVLLPGIGGQENYNAKFVAKNHYGVRIKGLLSFKWFMKKYFIDPHKYLDNYNDNKINNESLKLISALIKKL
ncbi:MAG: hypothetical protein E7164_03575 [Firmicutes bacterium]|nr:hypothetical protein [Bacillota bacterium]